MNDEFVRLDSFGGYDPQPIQRDKRGWPLWHGEEVDVFDLLGDLRNAYGYLRRIGRMTPADYVSETQKHRRHRTAGNGIEAIEILRAQRANLDSKENPKNESV